MTPTFRCKLCGYDTADRINKAIDNKTEMTVHLIAVHNLDPQNLRQKPTNITIKKKHFWQS